MNAQMGKVRTKTKAREKSQHNAMCDGKQCVFFQRAKAQRRSKTNKR